jgi:hypothetical protein
MINVPLGDQFALRGVGWYEQRGGFIDEYVGLNAVTKSRMRTRSSVSAGESWRAGSRART